MTISLDADSIIDEARQRTGLTDLGDPSFEPPMRRLVEAMDVEADLNEAGRAAQRGRVVGILVNRLRAEETLRRYPEIADEPIEAPLVIVGMARTGTTMLHRMISSDPRMFTLIWWEGRHPAPFDPDDLDAAGPDPRIEAAEAEVQAMIEGAPELAAAHPFDAHAPDEEIMLLEHSFFSTNPEAYVNVPRFSAWLDSQDQRAGYRYLRRLLQLIQWQKKRRGDPGERWVLKTPHHLSFMDLLLAEFPDARIVQTHRDPMQTIPSFASLVHLIRTLSTDRSDPEQVGRQWSDRMCRGVHKTMRVRESYPGSFLDVRYEELVADPMAQVKRIYAFFDIDWSPDSEESMREWAVENAREKSLVHRYTLEEFGFSEDRLRADFAAYRARYLD